MADSILRDKSKEYAIQIVYLCRNMRSKHHEAVLVNQLLRSGTSVGANIHEAQYAQGTKDFISKMEIALKECYESEYWLDLLYSTETLDETEMKTLMSQAGTIRRMLISTITTVKKNPSPSAEEMMICSSMVGID